MKLATAEQWFKEWSQRNVQHPDRERLYREFYSAVTSAYIQSLKDTGAFPEKFYLGIEPGQQKRDNREPVPASSPLQKDSRLAPTVMPFADNLPPTWNSPIEGCATADSGQGWKTGAALRGMPFAPFSEVS